ncbi:MAG: PSD1 and planctomycete cytochrome C domain-containing protein [Verrucomicrobiota bacterium]
MNESDLQKLERWLLELEEGSISANDRAELENRIAEDFEVADYVASRMMLVAGLADLDESILDDSARKIVALPGSSKSSRKSRWSRLAMAGGAAALLMAFGAMFLFQTKEESLELVVYPSRASQPEPALVKKDPMEEPFVAIANRGSKNHPELTAAAVAVIEPEIPALPQTVDYNDHIRPILNQKCLACHGGVKKSGGISYLFPEEALAKGKSGEFAIVPGDPDASEMLYRITTDDEVDLMPPSDHHDRLSDHEVALIERWIEQGAKFNDHWAFLPIEKPEVPEIDAAESPIDAYILKGLKERGITPTPLADRYTQLRRLSLDLTGVPPTPSEISAFIADESPDAYEKQIDRLLASPLYGERWAAMWLDIARYSDTKGYEKDSSRDVWLYRDWLIDAFNRDLPYDQFLTEQLAGDLLPNATRDQIVATAFHRNTMNNTEGGTNDEEFRVAAVMDRVNTTFESLLGVTMNCVQCHSHPYDPIRMEEFYEVYAVFNNSADSDRNNDFPILKTFGRESADEHAKLNSDFQLTLGSIRESWEKDPKHAEHVKVWKAEVRAAYERSWSPLKKAEVQGSAGTIFQVDEEGVWTAETQPEISESISLTLPEVKEARKVHAIRLELLPLEGEQAGKYTYADSGKAVISSLWVERFRNGTGKKLPPTRFDSNAGEAGYEVQVIRDSRNIISAWKATAESGNPWAVGTYNAPLELEPGDKVHLRINHAYPGAREEVTARFRILLCEEDRFPFRRHLDDATLAMALPELRVPQDVIYEPSEISLFRSGAISHPLGKQLLGQHSALKKLETTPVIVMQELEEKYRRDSHVFVGGNWMIHGDKVEPGAPASIAPWKDEFPPNRLGLAQWMTSRENALTARVAVNRFWEQLFGEGLVITVEDLGTMGAKPEYRELLDWLALDFKTHRGWSMKALLKDIVMSDAYRRSSDVSPELLAADRANHYLSRGPRFRLSAETIRDQALLASGLLSGKMHGPSVMPFQPEGIWNSVYNKQQWETSKGEDQYRRALYTYWKRSSPYPSMLAFDATAREVCSPRRIRTNTPLQALVTLNDPVYVEAANALAKLMAEQPGELEEKLNHGFLRVLSRPASDTDLDMLRSAYQDALSESDETLAMTFVARILLNLDEALTKS